MKGTLIILASLLAFFCCFAQDETVVDLGKIGEYTEIGGKLGYLADPQKKISADSVAGYSFDFHRSDPGFNVRHLDENYFIKLDLENSGSPNDSFCLYIGQAIDFDIYDYDFTLKKMVKQDQREVTHSSILMTDIPYYPISLFHGQKKILFIQPDIRFYNWKNFHPVIYAKKEAINFASQHFMIPNRLYIMLTLPMLGIMFSIMAYTFTRYLRIGRREYFYYSMAALCFIVDFTFQMVNLFSFNKISHYFDLYRHHLSQVGGTIFYLLFITKFLNLKDHFPRTYRACWIFIYVLIGFFILDTFFIFNTSLFYISHYAFNVVRVTILLFTLWLAIFLLFLNNRLARLVASGVFSVSILAMAALYVLLSNRDNFQAFDLIGLSTILFMLGIVMEMFFFVQAITYRNRMEELNRVKAVELLQIENDRKELEKYRAIMEAREKERNRIAQEMHDDIGSGLTSIRLLSEIAKAKSNAQGMEEVEKISSSANNLIEKMNEIIWSMNSRNDSLPSLIAYIRHQVVEFFEPFTIKLRIITPESIPETVISGEMRRNIVLAVKEALHNIIKHSNATNVEVHFTLDKDLRILISDNGTGIDPREIQHHSNGLRNMEDRMKSIGGKFNLAGEMGTVVTFHIPMSDRI